jgi:hypothetical protein
MIGFRITGHSERLLVLKDREKPAVMSLRLTETGDQPPR